MDKQKLKNGFRKRKKYWSGNTEKRKWGNEIKSLRNSAHESGKNMMFYNNEQDCRTRERLEATQTRL